MRRTADVVEWEDLSPTWVGPARSATEDAPVVEHAAPGDCSQDVARGGRSQDQDGAGRVRRLFGAAVAVVVGAAMLAVPADAAEAPGLVHGLADPSGTVLSGAGLSGTGVAASGPVDVIVRAPGLGSDVAAAAVDATGGTVTGPLELIDAVAATVDAGAIDELVADGLLVTGDDGVEFHTAGAADGQAMSLDRVRASLGVPDGATGRGIDIALIDSGVAPVIGMQQPGQVVNGPDLSFEGGNPGLRHLDTFGHGTHLAGIINATPDATGSAGIAPGARIVNVKVADATGATDVSQVIAAIDWVVRNRNQGGLNVRVLALAFGTDGGAQAHDPLEAAVEAAWHAGIVVVVAAGNAGGQRWGLNNPATSRYVVAVGAVDNNDTFETWDDRIPQWSSKGAGGRNGRNPDVVAPGVSIVSLRVPGSMADQRHPYAAVGKAGIRGSGTSQAAAVTAASVALLLERNPHLTPDQVKFGLQRGARDLRRVRSNEDGHGHVDVRRAERRANRAHPRSRWVRQRYHGSNGSGSLAVARGSQSVQVPVFDESGAIVGWDVVDGEETAFGVDWNGSAQGMTGATDGDWSGASWSGASWSGASWSGASWSGASWSGASWSGASWSGASWSGASWSGASWSGASWSGSGWSGASWSGASWSGASWSTAVWG